MSKEIGEFDFLSLTKAQWAHLYLIEREHGIPWNIYIRDLVKADMEGRLLSPDVRERRKKLPADITPSSIEKSIQRIEKMLNDPQKFFSGLRIETVTSAASVQTIQPNITEDENIKPSDLIAIVEEEKEVDPDQLADGGSVRGLRGDLMSELHTKLGIEPKKKKSVPISFGDHIRVTDAPDPPKVVMALDPAEDGESEVVVAIDGAISEPVDLREGGLGEVKEKKEKKPKKKKKRGRFRRKKKGD